MPSSSSSSPSPPSARAGCTGRPTTDAAAAATPVTSADRKNSWRDASEEESKDDDAWSRWAVVRRVSATIRAGVVSVVSGDGRGARRKPAASKGRRSSARSGPSRSDRAAAAMALLFGLRLVRCLFFFLVGLTAVVTGLDLAASNTTESLN